MPLGDQPQVVEQLRHRLELAAVWELHQTVEVSLPMSLTTPPWRCTGQGWRRWLLSRSRSSLVGTHGLAEVIPAGCRLTGLLDVALTVALALPAALF